MSTVNNQSSIKLTASKVIQLCTKKLEGIHVAKSERLVERYNEWAYAWFFGPAFFRWFIPSHYPIITDTQKALVDFADRSTWPKQLARWADKENSIGIDNECLATAFLYGQQISIVKRLLGAAEALQPGDEITVTTADYYEIT